MTLRDLRRRVRSLFRPRQDERDLHDELAFHLDREAERLRAAGHDVHAARHNAAVRFGSAPLVADQCRDERGIAPLTDIGADIRFAVRLFLRHPGTVLIMTLVLALGLGVSSSVFVLLSSFESSPPAGVHREDDLVRIRGIDASRGPGRNIGREFPYAEFRQFASQLDTFSALAAWTSTDATLDVSVAAPNLQSGAATFITAGYFSVLGVRPTLGAGLPVDFRDEGEPLLAGVISHVVWERFYDKATDVVGRTLKVNGVSITIVGVAPRRFVGARTGGSAIRVWLPLNARPVVQRASLQPAGADQATFGLVARLQPGVDLARATSTVATISDRFSLAQTPPSSRRVSTDVVPLLASNYFPPSGEEPGSTGRIVAFLNPLIVLLITCTNVSALLAGLALSRRREIAVRLAMGAHRRRIIRQLLTETALLAMAAGAVGLFIVWLLIRAFDASVMDTPLTLDWRAAIFTFPLALLTGLAFGLAPALHTTRLGVSDVLKESDPSPSRSRLQAGLVVAQIAFTQPALLAMGAALLELRSDLRGQPSSAFADQILDVRFNTNPRYGALDARREDTLRRLQARLVALPGVIGVAPQSIYYDSVMIDEPVNDAAPASIEARVQNAPPGYFTVMGRTLARGRDFNATDSRSTRTVIIGERLARRLFGESDPIGRPVVAEGEGNPPRSGTFTVVGVVKEDETDTDEDDDRAFVFFVPDVSVTGHFLIRTEGPAQRSLSGIRAVAAEEAPDAPIVSARTLAEIEAEARSTVTRLFMAVGGSGLLALALAAIGLYSVTAFAVGQRVREIGIRTALGADHSRVVGLFLRRGLRISLIGLTGGLALSIIVVRARAAVEGHPPPDGLLILSIAVAAFVLIVTLVSVWIPARRAAAIDPMVALRNE